MLIPDHLVSGPSNPGRLEALAALEQLPLRLRLLAQPEQANEALGGVVIELSPLS